MRNCSLTGLVVMMFALSSCRGDLAERPAKTLALAKDGKTSIVIAESANATEPEKYAVRELAEFLNRVTGAEFPIKAESTAGKGPRIYVGWTEFTADAGIDTNKLGEEEWVIRTVGGDLIITGGRPRGTLYGVYEFLEDHVGCHWLDQKTEVIPSKPTLTVKPLSVQAKPQFWRRCVHSPTGCDDDQWRFMVRNKNYRYDFRGRRDFFPQGAFHQLDGYPGKGHSFSYYVDAKKHFDAHPEYFSLVKGKRLPSYDAYGPGQLCLTNPETLRLTLENLRRFIAKDRKDAAEKGCQPPCVYMIGQNDRYHAHCQCPACQAIAKREESEAGPLVEFLNAVGEDIEKDHPEILLKTYAYNLTSKPPKFAHARDNVLIGWCDVYGKCDGIRPLTHPYNQENHDEIVGWGKIAPRLGIGDDYWTALSCYETFPTPYEIVTCIAKDLKLFAVQGCESFYAEAAEYMEAGQHFIPLRFWLAYQLLVDPCQPVEPLIKTFMDGYYGPAAGKMREYLRYLRKRIDADAQFMAFRGNPHKLAYLDLEFFKTSAELFGEAQKLVKNNALYAKHVRDERFILDAALLFMWPWLQRNLPDGESMPFDKETVIKRFEEEWRSFVKGRYSSFYSHNSRLNKDGRLRERMAKLFRDPQLPERFTNLPFKEVADFNWLTFANFRPRQIFIHDDEATGGVAVTFAERSAIQKAEKGGDQSDVAAAEQFRKSVSFGATNGPTVTLKPEEIPQDGKYHLHKIGRVRVKPGNASSVNTGTTIWALNKRLGVCVDRVYESRADDPAANDWNAYISLKFQGPAYVKGSNKPNGVWMDRVLLVKPQPNEPIDDTCKAYLEEERRRATLRPKITVPKLTENVDGDPTRVDWAKAINTETWWNHKSDGGKPNRDLSAKFAHDGKWLYLHLNERMDPKDLVVDSGIWRGDDWDLLIAPERGVSLYRQIAINPAGKFVERAYGEPAWKSGAKTVSTVDDHGWTLNLAIPLRNLVPGGAKPGQAIYVNIMRGGKENLFWSPIFGERYHSLERLGTVQLSE